MNMQDVTREALFIRNLKLMKEKKQTKLKEVCKAMDFMIVSSCCQEFVLPFVSKLQPLVESQKLSSYQLLLQTNQFFVVLNALLARLADNIQLNANNEDPFEYPILETLRDTIYSIVLVSTVWSYGACLDKEGRKHFESTFVEYRSKFNINFS
jgi:hypothetical protein